MFINTNDVDVLCTMGTRNEGYILFSPVTSVRLEIEYHPFGDMFRSSIEDKFKVIIHFQGLRKISEVFIVGGVVKPV